MNDRRKLRDALKRIVCALRSARRIADDGEILLQLANAEARVVRCKEILVNQQKQKQGETQT